MDIETLYNTLTNSTYFKSGTLTLPANAFGTEGIHDLLSTWFETGLLVINQILSPPEKNNDTIVFNGQMSFLGTQNIAVQKVTFFLIDGNNDPASSGSPALFFEFPLPVAPNLLNLWKFSSAFPKLAGSDLDELNFLNSASFLLSSCNLSQTALQIIVGQQFPNVVSGLNFYSSNLLTTSLVFSNIKPLLGTASTFEINGPISILAGSVQARDQLVPKINIMSQTPVPSPFLGAEFFLSIINPWDTTTGQLLNPALLIEANITITQGVDIVLAANFANLGKALVLEAQIGEAVTYALSDLSNWINKAPLGNVLSSYSFNLAEDVTVTQIRLFFNVAQLTRDFNNALSAVSITLGTVPGKTWNIIPGYFSLEDINVSFMVNDPLGQQNIITSVVGQVDFLDDIQLDAFGSFPDASFGLTTLSPVNLTQVFSKLGLIVSGFPNLICQNFYVEATPNDGPFSVNMDITSDWNINLGIRNIKLTNAGLALEYNKGESPAITGAVTAAAELVPQSGDENLNVPVFEVNWNIPGVFTLTGTFPDINLTDLAEAIVNDSDLNLPQDFPVITLSNSTLSLTVSNQSSNNQPMGTEYDFFLQTTIDFNSSSGITFAGQVIKTPSNIGFAACIWTDNWQWSPASLWDLFSTVLSGINFERSGLAISSLENASIEFSGAPTNLPSTVGKGVTFFSEISFGTSPLQTLIHFFGSASSVELYAYIADPLNQSQFIAKIGNSTTTNKYAFSGLEVIILPANESFSIQAGVSFTFTDVNGQETTLDFIGGGSLSLKGEFDLYFILKGDSLELLLKKDTPPSTSPGWKNPLGINGLTINNFWGEIGVDEEGELLLGFGGDVIIKDVNLDLDLVGGFVDEVPVIDVFKFAISTPSTKISITDLISTFTQLNLDWVPILNAIDLENFMLAVVLDPQGWQNPVTQKVWLPGFYSSGDVSFYGFEAVFDIEIIFERGIKASGYVDKPLELADGIFKLSDATGNKGPSGAINTLDLTGSGSNNYLELSGSVTLLEMTATILANIENGGWQFDWKADDFIFTDSVTCSLQGGNFTASTTGTLDLDINTGSGVTLGGIEIIPPINFQSEFSLGITITINPGFDFKVDGSFEFGGETLDVSLNLDIQSWNDLSSALTRYFETYPQELFKDLVNDAEKWAKVLAAGVFKIEADVAEVLKTAFNIAAHEAAEILQNLAMSGEDIINNLVKWWNLTGEEAENIVDTLENCAMTTAIKALGEE